LPKFAAIQHPSLHDFVRSIRRGCVAKNRIAHFHLPRSAGSGRDARQVARGLDSARHGELPPFKKIRIQTAWAAVHSISAAMTRASLVAEEREQDRAVVSHRINSVDSVDSV
jgi:hypothetical protein